MGRRPALGRRVLEAVHRSQTLSVDSLSRAGENRDAVAAVAQHQQQFEQSQAQNQSRVRAVAGQVRLLTALATLWQRWRTTRATAPPRR